MTRSAATSALRQILEEGVSVTLPFNLCSGFADAGNALRSSVSTASSSRAGQVSAIGLRPYTVEEKFIMLKRMLERGQASLAPGVSLEMIKLEMKKPENDGLGVKDMAAVLAKKKMLKLAAPGPALKVQQVLRPHF